MEESAGSFTGRLKTALDEKGLFIRETALDNLKSSISEYREALETLINSLYNSNLLEADLYKSSHIIRKLKLPSNEPIENSKRNAEISFRMYDFLKQFDFLENGYDFSLERISILQVNKLAKFFSFINWSRLSLNESSPAEAAIAGLEQIIGNGNHPLLTGLFRDCRRRLSDASLRIFNSLKDIQIFLNEQYKLDIREKVLSVITVDPDHARMKPDEIIRSVKDFIKTEMGESAFHPGLIRQIISEDFSGEASEPRKETLERIDRNYTRQKNGKETRAAAGENENKAALLEGMRFISACGSSLVNISAKLDHNADVLENFNISLIHRLRTLLFGKAKSKENRIYEILIPDEDGENEHRQSMDLSEFTGELASSGYKLIILGNKNSKAHIKMTALPELHIEALLERNIKMISGYRPKLSAIDSYMRNSSTNAMKTRMKGFKLDLNDIQSCLQKAASAIPP